MDEKYLIWKTVMREKSANSEAIFISPATITQRIPLHK